jgi:hypothetical protein
MQGLYKNLVPKSTQAVIFTKRRQSLTELGVICTLAVGGSHVISSHFISASKKDQNNGIK